MLILLFFCAPLLHGQQTVKAPMRDGIALATDLYNADPAVRRPVLLMRTPYNKSNIKATATRYAAAGYAVAVQDVRGRYASAGTSLPYNNEGQDGFDTLEWIVRQAWCDGRVGMWGASAVGAVQWQAAAEGATGLAVLCPTATWGSFYRNIYHGGAARLALIAQAAAGRAAPPPGKAPPMDWAPVLLHLPLSDLDEAIGWRMPWLSGILTHPHPNGFWKRLDLTRELERLSIPAQHIVGYYDFFLRETVSNFLRARKNSQQQLILGPWDHGSIGRTKVGDVDFAAAAALDVVQENLAWFDRHLLGKKDAPLAHVRYFSMGDNAWQSADAWPPSHAVRTSFYLHSRGAANTRGGNGWLNRTAPSKEARNDSFRADPADPAPGVAEGNGRGKYGAIWGPADQRSIEDRQDVLVYDTGVLSQPVTIAGPVHAEIWGIADTPDADWVVKLIDVAPDGFAQNIALGILRSSFRESETTPRPLEPGRAYKFEVDMGHVAAKVAAGHSLRVDVGAACFPLFDRNTNTGEGVFTAKTKIATQQVWHNTHRPSRVMLWTIR